MKNEQAIKRKAKSSLSAYDRKIKQTPVHLHIPAAKGSCRKYVLILRKPLFMKQQKILSSLLCVFLPAHVFCATHTITFTNFSYNPSQLNVFVGDTIVFSGNFAAHPLSSTTIPSGAQSFHVSSGNSFTYVVTVAGTYNYRCDFHSDLGMNGSFTASVLSGTGDPLAGSLLIYPSPARNEIWLRGWHEPAKIKVYSALGKEVGGGVILPQQPFGTEQLQPGMYVVSVFDISGNIIGKSSLIKE